MIVYPRMTCDPEMNGSGEHPTRSDVIFSLAVHWVGPVMVISDRSKSEN